MIISRDVVFDESDSPFEAPSSAAFALSSTPFFSSDSSVLPFLTASSVITHDDLSCIAFPDSDCSEPTSTSLCLSLLSTRLCKPPGSWWIANSLPTSPPSSPPVTSLLSADAPSFYSEAASSEHRDVRLPGIQREDDAPRATGTFELLERPSDVHVISCRYVFRTENDVDPKARIAANSFRQVPRVEFHDSYALVISLFTVCLSYPSSMPAPRLQSNGCGHCLSE